MDIIVVGGGISGMATAYAIEREAERRGVRSTVRLFEREARLGGKVDSRQIEGFVVEGGVNGWLDSKPHTDALCGRLGISERRLVSNDSSRRRFVFRHDRLHRLPESPGTFMRSGLMSLRGRLRVVGELWAKGPPPGDETLADFARRRLGAEALEALLDPMVSGIFAGDPERMSLKSCFPRIAEVESQYGGLIRGMMTLQRQRARERRAAGNGPAAPAASAAGPGGKLVSFADGTSDLIETLRGALSTPPELSSPVQRVRKQGAAYHLLLAGDRTVQAERVVLATPAWASASMVADLDAHLATELAGIPYASASVVALGWREADMPHPLDGFGFLIPHAEGRSILGTLWDTSVFAHRAPSGHVLTRTIVGGMRRGTLALRTEAEQIRSVQQELGHILGVSAEPCLAHVVKHERAIPQYVPGHGQRLERITDRMQQHEGLFLTGNAYHGVGLNDCTREAERIAEQVLAD